jgi:hypothetical protein
MRPRGQRRLRDVAHDRLAIQFGDELGFVWRPAESLRLAGGEDDCHNLPHLRRLLHRATTRDADFGHPGLFCLSGLGRWTCSSALSP